jgi:pimeloyl-ACP methyl ester carboxylesterase
VAADPETSKQRPAPDDDLPVRGIPGLFYPGRLLSPPPIWREGRIATEYLRLVRNPVFQGKQVPHGDGRPVVLIPGFLAGDSSMGVMAEWLRRIGYYAELPGLTLNVLYSEVVLKRLTVRLVDVYGWKGRRVTLVGHSRGGILAKVLSHRHPEMVEQVFCLGSPIGNPYDVHPVTMAGVRVAQAFNFVRYGRTADIERRFLRDLAARAKVPITSIYSRSDGIVHWEACVRDDVRGIQVNSSHVGLALNADVYSILARLLPWPERGA